MRRVYLAGPINGKTDFECRAWRLSVTTSLPEGWEAIDPMARDYRGREMEMGVAQQIVDADKADIRRCDAVIANVRTPSAGTSMEVMWAHLLGIPVFAIANERVSPWIAAHSFLVVSNETQAVSALKDFPAHRSM